MATKGNVRALPTFSFSGHETFVFRYGWLKKAYDAVRENPQSFGDDQAIVTLGVGKNMVRSIRHWALATGVLAEEPKTRGMQLCTTPLADFQSCMPRGFNSVRRRWQTFCLAPPAMILILRIRTRCGFFIGTCCRIDSVAPRGSGHSTCSPQTSSRATDSCSRLLKKCAARMSGRPMRIRSAEMSRFS